MFAFSDQPLRCIAKSRYGMQFMSKASTEQKNLKKSPNPDEAYEYFGSEAEKLRATPKTQKSDEYKSYIVGGSMLVFMLYFFILREPNDLDDAMERDLYDHFGPEVSRLKKAYDYNIQHNLPTAEITNRLRQLGAPVPPTV